MLQRCPVVCSSLLKHVSVGMNMHTTVEELRTVIINQSAPKPYKAACQSQSCWTQQGGKLHYSQSCEMVKYGLESCGSQK
jgi:hypothetical protein